MYSRYLTSAHKTDVKEDNGEKGRGKSAMRGDMVQTKRKEKVNDGRAAAKWECWEYWRRQKAT